MKMKQVFLKLGMICLMLGFIGLEAYAEVKLPSVVGSGMVLQRNEPLKIWGWANPGEKVTVSFMKKKHSAKAGTDGKWMVKLDPLAAGGPYTMTISGENKIELKDIYLGDVWICSGQSNMTHHFDRWQEKYAKEIAESENPEIRQLFVPTTATVYGPLDDIEGLNWQGANPDNLLGFTVVGYFFAKKLYDKYKVPQGIINTCVGGTPIEAWISEEGYKDFPDIIEKIKENKDTSSIDRTERPALQGRLGSRGPRVEPDKGLAGPVKWYDPAYEPLNWKRMNIPGYWEDQGIKNLDGVVWYRRIITLPDNYKEDAAIVNLGRIVNADELYINGEKVGNTTYEYPQREYKIKPGVLKAGDNLFVIRVTNSGGKGGFVPDKPYLLRTGSLTVDLKGDWEYKVGEVTQRRRFNFGGGSGNNNGGGQGNMPAFRPPVNPQNAPTGLYNGMIAPYINFAVRGFLWYQGESNAGNPDEYSKYLPAIINDWRNKWQQGDLAFLIAQLPNYMEVNYSPEESNWAKLRNVQLETALAMNNVGLGINIELGEWNDIHPGNKKPVGERLALQAMKISYGDNEPVSSGPIRKQARVEDGKVIISFSNIGSGLMSGNGEELAHFAIAGEDKQFEWASAEIINNEVVLSCESIENPKYVRYAWADNPDFANLINKEGLPASPFELEIK